MKNIIHIRRILVGVLILAGCGGGEKQTDVLASTTTTVLPIEVPIPSATVTTVPLMTTTTAPRLKVTTAPKVTTTTVPLKVATTTTAPVTVTVPTTPTTLPAPTTTTTVSAPTTTTTAPHPTCTDTTLDMARPDYSGMTLDQIKSMSSAWGASYNTNLRSYAWCVKADAHIDPRHNDNSGGDGQLCGKKPASGVGYSEATDAQRDCLDAILLRGWR